MVLRAGLPLADYWNEWLVYCMVAKLAPFTKLEWARLLAKAYTKAYSEYKALENFLEERVKILLITAMELGLGNKVQKSQQRAGTSTGQITKGRKGSFAQAKPQGASFHTAINCDRKVSKTREKCALCGE